MNTKSLETQKMIGLKPIFCTLTGKRVVAQSTSEFIIPDGQVTWLRCEACQGWHVVINNKTSGNLESLTR